MSEPRGSELGTHIPLGALLRQPNLEGANTKPKRWSTGTSQNSTSSRLCSNPSHTCLRSFGALAPQLMTLLSRQTPANEFSSSAGFARFPTTPYGFSGIDCTSHSKLFRDFRSALSSNTGTAQVLAARSLYLKPRSVVVVGSSLFLVPVVMAVVLAAVMTILVVDMLLKILKLDKLRRLGL